jgi:hypothetical protein
VFHLQTEIDPIDATELNDMFEALQTSVRV